MSFQKLYDHCQTLAAPISRADIKKKTCELTGHTSVRLYRDGLNVDDVRGYFVSPKNMSHPFVHQNNGNPFIVIARDLNPCWARFVVVKELMHLFDPPLYSLGCGEEFEALLAEFASGLPNRSLAMVSEVQCFWMALAVLCPEPLRQELQNAVANKTKEHKDVAEQLKIPEQFIPHLLSPDFKKIIAHLLNPPTQQTML